jgi:hypothetical protein
MSIVNFETTPKHRKNVAGKSPLFFLVKSPSTLVKFPCQFSFIADFLEQKVPIEGLYIVPMVVHRKTI